MGVPPTHPFDFWIFHSKPSILGIFHLWKPPYIYIHTYIYIYIYIQYSSHYVWRDVYIDVKNITLYMMICGSPIAFPHRLAVWGILPDFQVILPIFTSGARTARARTRSATTTAAAGATGDGVQGGFWMGRSRQNAVK